MDELDHTHIRLQPVSDRAGVRRELGRPSPVSRPSAIFLHGTLKRLRILILNLAYQKVVNLYFKIWHRTYFM